MKRTHALILGGIITIIVAVVAFSTGYDLSTIRWGALWMIKRIDTDRLLIV